MPVIVMDFWLVDMVEGVNWAGLSLVTVPFKKGRPPRESLGTRIVFRSTA